MNARKLVAILAADVVGYSRLISADEAGAILQLGLLRRGIIEPGIAAHTGRLFKVMGDGFLAEFASAVQAVTCAIALQAATEQASASLPDDKKMRLRIGIHVGDVMVDGDDLMGDGVNIAARLEGIAAVGGLTISRAVHDQVRDRIDSTFDDKGEVELKNIARPVQVFALAGTKTAPLTAKISEAPALALPDKPSIAVLPFQNMSGDPEQEYFADGMVEDIITALSQFKSLFVIARNSSFTYKGNAVDIREVGRDLGVRYVLEGSVRKAGNRVRITGQLIEAATGAHIWAERFDGAINDIFELQDQVTMSVVGAIAPKLQIAEIERVNRKPTESLSAYDCFLRAQSYTSRLTPENYQKATDYLQRATELDSGFGLAKASLALFIVLGTLQGWAQPHDRERAVELARASIESDDDDPVLLRCAGHTLGYFTREHDMALGLLEKAAELNPNSSQVLTSLGWVRCFACQDPGPTIEAFERATRLSPRDPEHHYVLVGLAFAHSMAAQDDIAEQLAWRSMQEKPKLTIAHRAYVVALANLGRIDEAKLAAATLMDLDPAFTIQGRLANFRASDYKERYLASLRAAGLPE